MTPQKLQHLLLRLESELIFEGHAAAMNQDGEFKEAEVNRIQVELVKVGVVIRFIQGSLKERIGEMEWIGMK